MKLIFIILLGVVLNADVVICQGSSSVEVINGIIQKEEDIKEASMQLNITKSQIVMILNKEVYNFKFIKQIEHPSGFMMDAYNNGGSEEILYLKKQKVATYKSYYNESEYIAIFICKNKY